MSNENTKKFVNSLGKGNSDQAKTDIKNSLADKVSAALDDRKVAVAQSLYTTDNATQTADTKEVPSDENNK